MAGSQDGHGAVILGARPRRWHTRAVNAPNVNPGARRAALAALTAAALASAAAPAAAAPGASGPTGHDADPALAALVEAPGDGWGRDDLGAPGTPLPGETPPPPTVDTPGPLAPALARLFTAIPPDPEPKQLTNDKHYLISNEAHLDLWANAIRDRGGLYAGVGTDQNYVLMGWARPRVAVLFDFDQVVVNLQLVYGAFFRAADTPAAFVALWDPTHPGRVAGREAIEAAYGPGPDRRRALRAWRRARRLVFKRLRRSAKRYAKAGLATFLDDQEQYDSVRRLITEGRVFAVRGDLLASKTVRALADACREARVPVRVFYLSNTEMYFNYVRGFRPNMLALPFDERSVVLRTLPVKPADYRYMVQPGLNFQAWLRARSTKAVWRMTAKRRRKRLRPDAELYWVEPPPPAE